MTTLQYRAVAGILAALLLMLLFALLAGDKNLFDLHHLHQAEKTLALENGKLQARNDKLLAQVIDLKKGGDAVEELARGMLGYVKQGEVF
ncbi:MAG: septum formation initiator family protein, partial [Pseudomonadota bacterium]|nr:septum formation initiator family protein [Pseudomonadota bacterium]